LFKLLFRLAVDRRFVGMLLAQEVPEVKPDDDGKKHVDQGEDPHQFQEQPPFAAWNVVLSVTGAPPAKPTERPRFSARPQRFRSEIHVHADSSFLSTLRSTLMSRGFSSPSTASLVMMHRLTSLTEGSSYITSRRISSTIERNPRAPVFRSIALWAMSRSASSSNSNSTPSSSKIFLYCLTSAFFGSMRIRTRASMSRASSA